MEEQLPRTLTLWSGWVIQDEINEGHGTRGKGDVRSGPWLGVVVFGCTGLDKVILRRAIEDNQ